MKKFKFTLFSLLVIIFSGLLIQRFSGYFYTTPVGIVKSVKIIDSEQLLTVKLVNNTKKTVVVKVKFNGNESTNPVFNKNNQILLDNSTKKSSPDSCVKCYTMFLPFLLIKIDVFS
ncbi:hypothetical protein C9432_02890 [Enterococcus faecalis]|nr:hypothetical protein [Enterococcus faecalis]QCJ65876.1 hypothetical protein C9432_02890 [Enterococcus faecalis]